MCHAAYRHRAAHDIHRSLADKAAAQDEGVGAIGLQTLRHLQRLVNLHAALETVAHVHLHYHSHIVSRRLHHLFHTLVHETHTVFQRPAVDVMTAVGVGRKELADEIAVAGMYLDSVETGFASQADGIAVSTRHSRQLVGAKASDECRRIEVETCCGAYRRTAADALVRHIAAMSQLHRCSSTLGMNSISELAQASYYLLAHPQLTLERQTALSDGGISHCRHSNTACRDRLMIFQQLL